MAKSYRKFIAGTAAAAVVAAGAPSAFAAQSFTDQIPDWAKDAVDYLVEKDAIGGYPDGSYQAYNEIKRGEAAKILAVSLGLDIDDSAKASFADAKDHWASKYIAALQEQKPGVINGYGDGTFKPENTITREEMAKMVVEAYDLELDEEVEVDFKDNTGWGKEYVNVLASLGVVAGVSQGEFDPGANVTRGQLPVFIHRAEVKEARIDVKNPAPAPAVKPTLTIEGDSQGNTVTNGVQKTYTVTYKSSDGLPLQGVVLNVTFEENLGTSDDRKRNVVVTNSDNDSVIPYQADDGEEVAAEIVTNKDGKATFTVTGSNETVTPIVFLDGSYQEDDTDGGEPQLPNTQNDRFEANTELNVKAAPLTFKAASYSIEIEGKRTQNAAVAFDYDNSQEIEDDEQNGREYVIKVKRPDGTPFAGGYVNLGIEEYVDDVVNNNPTDAYYTLESLDDVNAVYPAGQEKNRQAVIKLNAQGEATVTLASTKANDKATPIVWVDINSSNLNQTGHLESGEPVSSSDDYTNFQPSRVDDGTLGAKLEVLDVTEDARDHYTGNTDWNVEDVKGFKLQLLNQSGKPFIPESWDRIEDYQLLARATFTIENTGANTIRVHANTFFGEADLLNAEGADDTTWTDGYVDIRPDGKVTISGDIQEDTFADYTEGTSATIVAYSLNGASSVNVTGSAVVDPTAFDEIPTVDDNFFPDEWYDESDSVYVGPVSNTATFRNSENAPQLVKVVEKSLDGDASIDTIELTFDEEVYDIDPQDFRLFTGTTAINEAVKNAVYGTKTDISKQDMKKVVLTVEEFAGLGDGFLIPTTLQYDPSWNGTDTALEDEFHNEVDAFIVRYVGVLADKDPNGERNDIGEDYTVEAR